MAITSDHLGICKVTLGVKQEAKQLFQKVLPIYDQHYGKDNKYSKRIRR